MRDVDVADVLPEPDQIAPQRQRGIDVRQVVHADRHRAQPARNSEERDRAGDAEEQHRSDQNPTVSQREWRNMSRDPVVHAAALCTCHSRWRAKDELQRGKQRERDDPGDEEPDCRPDSHLADGTDRGDRQGSEAQRGGVDRSGDGKQLVAESDELVLADRNSFRAVDEARVQVHERCQRGDQHRERHQHRYDGEGEAEQPSGCDRERDCGGERDHEGDQRPNRPVEQQRGGDDQRAEEREVSSRRSA